MATCGCPPCRSQPLRARRRSEDCRIDDIAVEDLALRQVPGGGAGDENISLTALVGRLSAMQWARLFRRLIGQGQARKRSKSGFELQVGAGAPGQSKVEAGRSRIGQGIEDGKAHVGHEICADGAVDYSTGSGWWIGDGR